MGTSRTGSQHRGSRSRAELLRACAALLTTVTVVGYSVLLGHLSGDRTGHRSGPATLGRVSSGLAEDPPTDDPPAQRRSSQVGVTREGGRSDTTLLQVRRVGSPRGRSAPDGQEWLGIRARTCRHAGSGDRDRSPWSDWAVETEDGDSFRGARVPWTDFPAQQLPTDGVAEGECAVGWVLVPVPRGTSRHVAVVRYRPYSPAGLEWEV